MGDQPEQTAALRVLFTVELLENILSFLPFQELNSAELVCRTWRDVISWSAPLKQNLFLEPSRHAMSIAWKNESKLINPEKYRSLKMHRYVETYTIALLHPYLQTDLNKERRGLIAFTMNWRRALSLDSDRRWRNMFVTQPPCRNIRIEFKVNTLRSSLTSRDTVKDTDGVRLGRLVNKVSEILQLQHVGENAQPRFNAAFGDEGIAWNGAWFDRLDCFIYGFVSPTSAFLEKVKEKKSGQVTPESAGAVGDGNVSSS